MLDVAKKFVDSVVPAVIKPLRVLWNEIIAFVFFVLAAVTLPSAWRSYKNFNGDFENLGRLVMTAIFGLVMLAYGLHSLFRARKLDGKSGKS